MFVKDAIAMKKDVKKKRFTTHEHFFKRFFSSTKEGKPPHHIANWNQDIHPSIAIQDGSIAIAADALTHNVSATVLCAVAAAQEPPMGSFSDNGRGVVRKASDCDYASVKCGNDVQMNENVYKKEEIRVKMFRDVGTMTFNENLSSFGFETVNLGPTFAKSDVTPKVDVVSSTSTRLNTLNFA